MIRYICGLNNINLLKIKRHVQRAKKKEKRQKYDDFIR